MFKVYAWSAQAVSLATPLLVGLDEDRNNTTKTVSYTHLTLPTRRTV